MTEINVGLLEELLLWASDQYAEQLAGRPSEWDQSVWVAPDDTCGTVCCLAGKAVLAAGHELFAGMTLRSGWMFTAGGEEIATVAVRELGLQDFTPIDPGSPEMDSGFSLFGSDNTLSDLWRWAYLATDGKVDMPARVVPLAIASCWDRAHARNQHYGPCPCGCGEGL